MSATNEVEGSRLEYLKMWITFDNLCLLNIESDSKNALEHTNKCIPHLNMTILDDKGLVRFDFICFAHSAQNDIGDDSQVWILHCVQDDRYNIFVSDSEKQSSIRDVCKSGVCLWIINATPEIATSVIPFPSRNDARP